MPARLIVLVSGAGTNLQALLDAAADPAFGAQIVAVGADRSGTRALARAERAGVNTFTHRVKDYPSRLDWDRALTASCAAARPDLIVLAGFMKLVGAPFLAEFGGRVINTHPALLPAFPGMHAVRDALEHGVKSPDARCSWWTRARTPARCWPRRPSRCSMTTMRPACTSGSR